MYKIADTAVETPKMTPNSFPENTFVLKLMSDYAFTF